MKKKVLGKLTLCAVVTVLVSFMLASCDTPTPSGCGTTGGIEQRDCVVMLGDSIFHLSGAIERHLRDYSNQKYRTYYMSATQMAGGVDDIESQYDRAIRQGRIRTIIMDGGGNDFLIGGGLIAPGPVITEISNAYKRIFKKAASDGVENIVVMGYYRTSSTNAATEESERQVREITLSAVQTFGGSLKKAVHWDPSTDPWFSNKRPASYTIVDGIHPTDAAANEMARMIWETMKNAGIEQGPGCQGF